MDEEEGEGEELVAQNVSDALAGDYRRIDELDEYDARDLDDREYAPISMAARQAAEVALATREEAEQRRFDRMPAALRDMSDGGWRAARGGWLVGRHRVDRKSVV